MTNSFTINTVQQTPRVPCVSAGFLDCGFEYREVQRNNKQWSNEYRRADVCPELHKKQFTNANLAKFQSDLHKITNKNHTIKFYQFTVSDLGLITRNAANKNESKTTKRDKTKSKTKEI